MELDVLALDQFYRNIEENCKKFSNIRLWVEESTITLENEKKIRYWPSPKDYNLNNLHYNYLSDKNIKIDSKYCSTYKISYNKYNELKTKFPENLLKYKRFKILRNYFAIFRLQTLLEENKGEIDLTIEYRPDNTNIENIPSSSSDLGKLDSLISNSDIILRFRKGFKKTKLVSDQIPLISDKLYSVNNINIKKVIRESSEKSIKLRDCILMKDIKSYNSFSNQSFNNFLNFIVNHDLYQSCVEIFKKSA